MKVNRKAIKRLKRILSPYNLAIFACIIVILVSLYIIIEPNINVNFNLFEAKSQEETSVDETKQITEKDARKIAKKKFKELGEKKVEEDDLSVTQIQREGNLCYYVCSSENTVEINISGGKITRVNSVAVSE
jgi:short subunit fatty acids transporter